MADHVLSDTSKGVLTLTLNRPEKKNALTRAMYQALADGIDEAERNDAVRCVLIQAEGDMFTAGNDLSDFAAANRGEPSAGAVRRRGNPLLIALARARIPIAAAVNGRAVGICRKRGRGCRKRKGPSGRGGKTPAQDLRTDLPSTSTPLILTIGHQQAEEQQMTPAQGVCVIPHRLVGTCRRNPEPEEAVPRDPPQDQRNGQDHQDGTDRVHRHSVSESSTRLV
jgi:hypothetical protein